MLVVASDLHMTDRDTGSAVSDEELVAFVREVQALEPSGEKLTLLLLGDVIDFLRSEKWEELWKTRGAAPWSALGKDFDGFEGSHQETTLVSIAEAVEAKYKGFREALKELKKARTTRVLYLPGNHDFMVQLSPAVRTRVASFLSLDQDAAEEFPVEFSDAGLDVHAEHGNRYDVTNWHQRGPGLWAIGDAIVLRIVNRFGTLAREKLGLSDKTPLGRAVHEIDNVEPHTHIPLYIAWLAKTLLVSGTERKKLLTCWDTTVTEFLDIEDFREGRYGKIADAIKWLRLLYKTGIDVNQLLKLLDKVPDAIAVNYARKAHLIRTDAKLRIFGHTHEHGARALPVVAKERRFYLNTGTWRRVITRVRIEDGIDFAGYRVATFLVVRKGGEFSLTSRCRNS